MDFYLSLGGEKAGPFSIFKVGELLESGAATPDTLAWHRGLEEWRPIGEIPALDAVRERNRPESAEPPSPPPLPDPAVPAAPPLAPYPGTPLPEVGPAQAQVLAAAIEPSRPFPRFWARMFDCTLVMTLVLHLSDAVPPQPQPGEGAAEFITRYFEEMRKPEAFVFVRTLFLALVGWHVLEAVLVHLIGTTPGKALFGIKVRAPGGGRLPVMVSLGRSFYVYVMGMGFYISPLILIGMIFSFFRLTTTGQCLWDQHLKIKVEQSPLSAGRIVLAILAFFVLLTLK